jgi:hypothetical protein
MVHRLPRVPSRTTTRSALPLVAACNLVAFVALLPWYLTIGGMRAVLCVAIVGVAMTGAVRACYPRPRLVQLVCFSFAFMYLGVAPTYQLQSGSAAWGDTSVLQDGNSVIGALLFLAISLLGVLLASEWAARMRPGDWDDAASGVTLPEVRSFVAWGCLLACAALTPRTVAINGGVGGLFSSRAERTQTLAAQGISIAESGGVAVALYSILPLVLSLVATYLFVVRMIPTIKERGWLRVRSADLAGLLAASGLFVLFGNPFINSRFSSLAAIGALGLIIVRPRSPRTGFALCGALILGVGLLYPLLNLFRGSVTSTASSSGSAVYASADFDGFQQVINGLAYARAVPGPIGHYTLSAVLYFVPRSLWEGKAAPASIDVASWHGYRFTNLSLPLPAELAIDFGLVGALAVLILLGVLMGFADRAWVIGTNPRVAVLVPYAAFATISLLRGPLGSLAPIYLTILALFWVGTRHPRPQLEQVRTEQPQLAIRH